MTAAAPVPPNSDWSETEQWVWGQLRDGKVADLNAHFGTTLDPKADESWPADRTLSPEFLETILLHDPFRGALTRRGVRIDGACFTEAIDLANAELGHEVRLHRCRMAADVNLTELRTSRLFSVNRSCMLGEVLLDRAIFSGVLSMQESKFTGMLRMTALRAERDLHMRYAGFVEVDLNSAKIGGSLEMDGSKFTGKLNMDKLQVDSSLFMRGKAEFGEVVLRSAKIGDTLSMIGSKFTGKLNMDKLQVDSSLFMRGGAEFGEVVLIAAKIGGTLDMNASKFTGKLDMDRVQVGSSLFMRDCPEVGEMVLHGAGIGGSLDMRRSKITGKLSMRVLEVDREFLMRESECAELIDLYFAKIASNFDLSGAKLKRVNLTGTRIGNELRLGSPEYPAVEWREDAELDLRNTVVGTLEDRKESWPDDLKLDLKGFSPKQLGHDATERPAKWFVDWLAKDPDYSPQPYEQIAAVLRGSGHGGKANTILYAGKERGRRQADWWSRRGLLLLKWTIGYGYGYRNFGALAWVGIFVAIGALVLNVFGEAPLPKSSSFEYSLDMLLPIIKLRELHYTNCYDLVNDWVRYYFSFHKLVGYVLASFLIAGLAGITKR